MRKYNALTKWLLEEGYSAGHHPDYVRVDVPMWQEKTLDHYDGGFTYERWWITEHQQVAEASRIVRMR